MVDGLTTTDMTSEQGIDKLAAQPLMSQPGAAWNYSLSTDVLGRVVEVASDQPFDVFLRERIFKPLGMSDTDFVVAGRQVVAPGDGLLARCRRRNPADEGSGIVRQHAHVAARVLQGGEEVLLRAARA